jgi:hypothetical protein
MDSDTDDNKDRNLSSDLVVVAQFLMEREFLFARGRLESAGIECFCVNEYLSRISSGIYNGMTGGIALKVRRQDLDDARAILNDPGKPYLVR